MLVLLPPSETKAPGGSRRTLELARLSWPELTATRTRLVDELTILAKDPDAARVALELSPRQDDQIELNRTLATSPVAPALRRYNGVLYDALDIASLGRTEQARARRRIAIGSALFGLLRPADPIPAYRLSAGSVLPQTGRLTGVWRPVLEPVLAELAATQLIVDLRSGAYADLARCPAAVTVQVLTEQPDGTRSVVSHHNKATKGRLARALATAVRAPRSVDGVARIAHDAGLRAEVAGPRSLVVLTE